MATLYDAKGNAIDVGGGSGGDVADKSITPEKLAGVVKNIFDLSQNTEENAYIEASKAYHNDAGRYWGGVGSYDGEYFSYMIPVKPGETYYLQNINNMAEPNKLVSAVFYTGDKELTTQTGTLSAVGNYITVPVTAAYMRIPVHADTVDTVMVLSGTDKPLGVYVPYGYIVPELFGDVGDKGIPWKKLAMNAKPHRFYGARVGCLGDSLTEMGGRWQAKLAEKLGFASITNYGMSGTTVTSARGEGEHTYRDRAPNMSNDLDLIIVMTSINDHGAPYGVYNEAEKTGTLEGATDKTSNDVSTIAGAGLALIDILRNKYPHADIVFFSHPHTHWGWSFGEADMYRKICGRHSIPFFDLLRYSGIDGTVEADNAHFFTDGTHLTDAGNDKVAEYMAACLRTI